MMMEPASTGANRKSQETLERTPTSATAPAGGWTVLESFVNVIVVETASAITHGCGPSICTRLTDTIAPVRFPPITFLGCANGL